MHHYERFITCSKKYFYALFLTCSLDLHSPKSTFSFSENSQENLQDNKDKSCEKKRRYSFGEFLQRKVSETSRQSLLSKNKIAQQKKLKAFCKKYPFRENFSSKDILNKTWTDLLSEIYDPSKELLVNIGFYKPTEKENLQDTPYLDMINKGEEELIKLIKLNKKNAFFVIKYKKYFINSLNSLTIEKNQEQEDKLSENFFQFVKDVNLETDVSSDHSFFENYFKYQNSHEILKLPGLSFCEETFLLGRGNFVAEAIKKNEFYTLYIRNIYQKILGLLFENVDLFNDFSHIIESGNFEEKYVSRLRKAINNILTPEDSLAFSLCALSFAACPYSYSSESYGDFDLYFHMFFPPFFTFSEFKGGFLRQRRPSIKSMTILSGLEYFHRGESQKYKFLSFKNTVNFKDSPNCCFQSFEKVNFSRGINLIVRTLIPTAQFPQNPFFKKLLDLQNYKRNLWLFIEDYFNQKASVKDNEINLLDRLAVLGLIISNGQQKDYEKYTKNLYQSRFKKFSTFFSKAASLYFAYDYKITSSHPLMKNNEKFFLESLHNVTKQFVLYTKNMTILDKFPTIQNNGIQYNYNNNEEFKKYYEENLLSMYLKKKNKKNIINNFLKIISISILPYHDNYFIEDDYNTDPFASLLHITKKKLKIFSQIKKFYFQQAQKIIAEDLAMMQLLRAFLKKKHIRKKNGEVIGLFQKMNSLDVEFFPYCSHYTIFHILMDYIKFVNKKYIEKTKKNLYFEEISEAIARKLANFYYATYRDFSFVQGITYNSFPKEKVKVFYRDPLFLALTIVCQNSLAPCLIEIMSLQKFINFTPLKRPC